MLLFYIFFYLLNFIIGQFVSSFTPLVTSKIILNLVSMASSFSHSSRVSFNHSSRDVSSRVVLILSLFTNYTFIIGHVLIIWQRIMLSYRFILSLIGSVIPSVWNFTIREGGIGFTLPLFFTRKLRRPNYANSKTVAPCTGN